MAPFSKSEKGAWHLFPFSLGTFFSLFLLEVLCGSTALFEIKIMLSDKEVEKMATEPSFVDKLAESIRNKPNDYSNRKLLNLKKI